MNNSDLPAAPLTGDAYIDINGGSYEEGSFEPGMGLTKREHFAAMAMQGLLSNPGGVVQANSMSGTNWCNCDADDMAQWSVSCADALLAELDK